MPAILAIDPGPTQSAMLRLVDDVVTDRMIAANDVVIGALRDDVSSWDDVVIETIEPWGGVVGPPALETMFWVGRFVEATSRNPATLLRRSAVIRALGITGLSSGKAQAACRALLIERWGGGNPVRRDHPLHGVREDLWSALALAVAYQEGLRP